MMLERSLQAAAILALAAGLAAAAAPPDPLSRSQSGRSKHSAGPRKAVAVGTWSFGEIAVREAARLLSEGKSAVDAAEAGVNAVELDTQAQYFVGLGGLPNADGHMEFDAAIMDGKGCKLGAVAALQGTVRAVSVARAVMTLSPHNVLVGEGASKFAREHGFPEERTLTDEAWVAWFDWKVGGITGAMTGQQALDEWLQGTASDVADARDAWVDQGKHAHMLRRIREAEIVKGAGRIREAGSLRGSERCDSPVGVGEGGLSGGVNETVGDELLRGTAGEEEESHDTIGLLCLDREGGICAATSTSGWKFKHAGRVGDAPLVGSGLYADAAVGGAVATGDGEAIMRSCLSFLAVEGMRRGLSPEETCQEAIARLRTVTAVSEEEQMHASLTVGIVALSIDGRVGASSTLSVKNPHREKPAFPVPIWKEGEGFSELLASEYTPPTHGGVLSSLMGCFGAGL